MDLQKHIHKISQKRYGVLQVIGQHCWMAWWVPSNYLLVCISIDWLLTRKLALYFGKLGILSHWMMLDISMISFWIRHQKWKICYQDLLKTVPHVSFDNNDKCQDTNTGKGTTHLTNFVLFQPTPTKNWQTSSSTFNSLVYRYWIKKSNQIFVWWKRSLVYAWRFELPYGLLDSFYEKYLQ